MPMPMTVLMMVERGSFFDDMLTSSDGEGKSGPFVRKNTVFEKQGDSRTATSADVA